MKRHPSLVAYSREHHEALVLARRIERAAGDAAARRSLCARVLEHYDTELALHFEAEEAHLLPGVAAAYPTLAARVIDDHAALRGLVQRIGGHDDEALGAFAALLAEHTRFEEREFFPAYESLVEAAGETTAPITPTTERKRP